MLERRSPRSRIVDLNAPEERVDIPVARNSSEAAPTSILLVLWRRRYVIAGCVVVALLSGLVYLKRAKPVYGGVSQIYVEPGLPSIMGDGTSSAGNTGNYLQTQCDVIKSTAVLAGAAEMPEVKATMTRYADESPVAVLKTAVNAQVGKQNDLITITAESYSPDDAAIFANAVVQAYVDYENRVHRSTAGEMVKILQAEKNRQEQEYASTSKQMLEFKRANATLSFSDGDKGNIILLRLSDLSQALTTAQLDALQDRLAAASVDAFGNDTKKIAQYMRAKSSQSLERDGGYAIDAETAENFVALLHEQVDIAQQRVDELQKAVDAQQELALDLNAKSAQYAQLDTQLRRTDKLIDELDSRIKELHVNEGGEESSANVSTISILETAKPATKPLRPTPGQTLGMSLVVGLMLGLGGAMLLDWMDQRIRSAAEIAAILDVPILGVLPHMLGEEKNSNRGQEVHINPKSEVAEAYRSIRTAIQFSNPDVKIKVLLVTSPAPGDGKTTVASNLAIVMAQGGRRVLLVDADMRRPMLHKMFSIGKKSGLNEVLSGRCALEDAILHSNTENLDLLPAGKVPSNPAELLHSDNFNSVLTALTEKYDQVIIDSPPVAPVTDARILTAICDATIFVLRADKTSRRVSEYAYDVLTSVGGSVLGLVINDVPVGRGEYGYYNGYSYYRYGYSQKNGSNKDSSDAETSHTNSQATSRKAIIVATASLSANGNGGAVGTPTTEREPDAHV